MERCPASQGFKGAFAALLVAFCSLIAERANASCSYTPTDEDGNCIQDLVELQLARQFCPTLVLHRDRLQEPEPVEILAGISLDSSEI